MYLIILVTSYFANSFYSADQLLLEAADSVGDARVVLTNRERTLHQSLHFQCCVFKKYLFFWQSNTNSDTEYQP